MAYKRAARIAFFSADGALADIAVRAAETFAVGWLVATAIACERVELSDWHSAERARAAWRQYDLLVSLDEPARLWLAQLQPPAPVRHYGIDDLAPAEQAGAVAQRVQSMVGGMRMLARSGC